MLTHQLGHRQNDDARSCHTCSLLRKCEVAICRRWASKLGDTQFRRALLPSCSPGCAHVCLPVGPACSCHRFCPLFYNDSLWALQMNALPAITPAQARMPQTYEVARAALAECQNIDECKDWADKAAALASYAKQAEDETLLRMAARIKARATRRAGELLKQIAPAKGGNRRSDQWEGDRPLMSRTNIARCAGMSSHQQKQALRVANVSTDEFEALVEADNPATITDLAAKGTTLTPRPVVDLQGRDPKEFKRAMHFIGTFEHFARELAREDIDASLASIDASERVRLREAINRIDAIHDQIMTRI